MIIGTLFNDFSTSASLTASLSFDRLSSPHLLPPPSLPSRLSPPMAGWRYQSDLNHLHFFALFISNSSTDCIFCRSSRKAKIKMISMNSRSCLISTKRANSTRFTCFHGRFFEELDNVDKQPWQKRRLLSADVKRVEVVTGVLSPLRSQMVVTTLCCDRKTGEFLRLVEQSYLL